MNLGEYFEELKLYRRKWFDYRPVCPEGCDMIFVAEWLRVHARHEDRNKLFVGLDDCGHEVRPQPWRGLTEMRYDLAFTALMRGLRRLCDRKGYRYDRWWSFAYQVLEGSSARDFAGAFAEFGSSVFKSSVVELYEEHRRSFIEFSEYICAANYTGAVWQREYFRHIREKTMLRYPETWRELLNKLAERGVYVEINQPV